MTMEDNNPRAKFLRLKTGDDLIAEVYEFSDSTGEYYTVINPLKTVYVPATNTGYLQIAFMPWVYPRICDMQQFNIPKQEVLIFQDVTEKMDDYYWESVESYLNSKREIADERIEEEPEEQISDEALEELMEAFKSGRIYH